MVYRGHIEVHPFDLGPDNQASAERQTWLQPDFVWRGEHGVTWYGSGMYQDRHRNFPGCGTLAILAEFSQGPRGPQVACGALGPPLLGLPGPSAPWARVPWRSWLPGAPGPPYGPLPGLSIFCCDLVATPALWPSRYYDASIQGVHWWQDYTRSGAPLVYYSGPDNTLYCWYYSAEQAAHAATMWRQAEIHVETNILPEFAAVGAVPTPARSAPF